MPPITESLRNSSRAQLAMIDFCFCMPDCDGLLKVTALDCSPPTEVSSPTGKFGTTSIRPMPCATWSSLALSTGDAGDQGRGVATDGLHVDGAEIELAIVEDCPAELVFGPGRNLGYLRGLQTRGE